MSIIVDFFITLLLVFYGLLAENVFLAIVGFTITVRMAIMPLTWRSIRSSRAMQAIQPQLQELREKYKDQSEVLAQKQMELFRENKVNPFAGCLPLLIQMPILFGLWRAITATLATNPTDLFSLSNRILFREELEGLGMNLDTLIPLNNHFMWLNLAVPDPYLLIPVLVVITTWLQQKLLTPPMPKSKNPNPDDPSEQAAAMTRQMTTIMPLMLGFFALSYSSGIGIYLVLANSIGVLQYSMMGRVKWGRLLGREELSEEEQAELEKYGRRRLHGINDSSDIPDKSFDSALMISSEKRSQRVKNARAKANRVKLDVN